MNTTAACGKCFDSKECLQFGCQKPERNMETAKDIIDRHIASTNSFMVAFEKAAAEIADKAWEAGRKREYMNCKGLKYHTPPPTKKKFMKSLFP